MSDWKTHERTTILSRPPFLHVENHVVALPDGRLIPDWTWVISPDYVNIVPVTEEGMFLCFRQTKYGLDGKSLGWPGGYIDEGEMPLVAAQRELREETGHEATSWQSLGSFRVDPNRGLGTAHFFLARGIHQVTEPDADDLEEQEMLFLSQIEVEQALDAGAFQGLPWVTVTALALRAWEEKG